MILTKRILLTLSIVSFFSIFISAQDKNTHFTFEPLPNENNVNAQFLENYSKGILHYNKAVDMIKSQNIDSNLDELDKVQKASITEFKLALPYFEKAYSINSKDEHVLLGLCGIYFALNEKEKSDKYRKEHDALHKK